jgi:hypothetical protein
MNGQKEAKKFQPNGNTWQVAYMCVCVRVCVLNWYELLLLEEVEAHRCPD